MTLPALFIPFPAGHVKFARLGINIIDLRATYVLSEYKFVDIPRKHGGGREDRGVCRGHDGGRHGAQSEERGVAGGQILEDHRQDHSRVVLRDWQRLVVLQEVVRLVPVCSLQVPNCL